jgi:Tol biopolymer transport system component
MRRVGSRPSAALASVLFMALAALVCSASASAGVYTAFTDPQVVSIAGFSGSAMEPFVSADGQYLLFNTSNVAPNIPSLQLATRTSATSYEYQGALPGEGVNEPGFLSGTPTMDLEGDLYFISTRSYLPMFSTVFAGELSAGQVTGVHQLTSVSSPMPGYVDFDVSVSPDGSRLYVSVGNFLAGGSPTSATVTVFDRTPTGFVADPQSAYVMRAVNKPGQLDYGASVSSDGLELFFTRVKPSKGPPAIYRASRTKLTKPFAHVQRVSSITGFAEAPSLSGDGRTLYYHELLGSQFAIESVTRP